MSSKFTAQAIRLLEERSRIDAAPRDRVGSPVQAMRWNAAGKADSFFWDYAQKSVAAGCSSPEKPIEISFEGTCLINFGVTVDLLETQMLRAVQESGKSDDPRQSQSRIKRFLGVLEMAYSEFHASTGVYNFEPWLQEMYRDCLDLDHRDTLMERARILEKELCEAPSRLSAMGIPGNLIREIMIAMQAFEQVRDQSVMREKTKSSVRNIRDYAKIVEHIQDVLEEASTYIHSNAFGESTSLLKEFFESWKESSSELFNLRKEIDVDQAGLTENITYLFSLMAAVRNTLSRCQEEEGEPQCSLLYADDIRNVCPRQVVEEEFEALLMHDIFALPDVKSERMEVRRFGPLSVIILPGTGIARYSSELRSLHSGKLENSSDKRDFALSRRINYPYNAIVFPSSTPPEKAVESLAEAFLEYKETCCPGIYRNAINDTRRLFPEIYELGKDEEPVKHHSRKALAKYLAAFIRWAKYGRTSDLPRFGDFLDWAKKCLSRPRMLVPHRYKAYVDDFSEATPERRETIYSRNLQDRYPVDRTLVVLHMVRGDLEKAIESCSRLSTGTRSNKFLSRATKALESELALERKQAENFFRQFLLSEPELKRLYVSFESQFTAETMALIRRARNERDVDLSWEQAAHAMSGRQEKVLLDRRRQANQFIDRDLLGLLYASEKNHVCALEELKEYVGLMEAQRDLRRMHPPRFDGSSLPEILGNRASRSQAEGVRKAMSATRIAGGSNREIIYEDDFVYYNLGSVAMSLGNLRAASDYFSRFCLWAAQTNWHHFGECARAINEEIEQKLLAESGI